ncbi:MAG TPA: glycosyltransferase WbuB [Gammaproteobacteria bacterium]|nr:glycosyltransferase WbuB [Gammaproteobacteria bacterium]
MKRNIIFLNRFFYPDHSATSQLLSDLAFYLADQKNTVTVICSHQVYDNSSQLLATRECKSGVNIYRIKTTNFGRHWLPGRMIDYLSYFTGMSWRLFRLVKSGDIVVAKTDPPLTSIFSICIAKLKRAYHVNWVQDLFPEVLVSVGIKGVPKSLFAALKILRNCSFRYSDKSVVIGEIMKKKLLACGLEEKRLEFIPNWSDKNIIWPVDKHLNPLRAEWHLADKFVVGYSGNMGRVHEFDTIINAAKRLQNKLDIVFVFIGSGPQKEYIESKAQSLNNVFFFPYQAYTALSNSLSLPDVHLVSLIPGIEGYCVPSKYYGIIAAGRPLIFIGDKKGEIPRMLRVDGCGYQINLGDDKNLSEKIVMLYENQQALDILAKKSLCSFQQKYEKNRALAKWSQLVQGIHSQTGP